MPHNRPNCKSCPMWEKEEWYFGSAPDAPGICHLEPDAIAKTGDDYCSHHPDFPTYVELVRSSGLATEFENHFREAL